MSSISAHPLADTRTHSPPTDAYAALPSAQATELHLQPSAQQSAATEGSAAAPARAGGNVGAEPSTRVSNSTAHGSPNPTPTQAAAKSAPSQAAAPHSDAAPNTNAAGSSASSMTQTDLSGAAGSGAGPATPTLLTISQLDEVTRSLIVSMMSISRPEEGHLPLTPKKWHDLYDRATKLFEQGELYKAWPMHCRLVWEGMQTFGFTHPNTLAAVCRVSDNLYHRRQYDEHVSHWLLPRIAERWGYAHFNTRVIAAQAATALVMMPDLRQPVGFLQTVTDIVRQLPDGLGWGSTAATPVPDADAFNRHVVLQHRADQLVTQSLRPPQLCICTNTQREGELGVRVQTSVVDNYVTFVCFVSCCIPSCPCGNCECC